MAAFEKLIDYDLLSWYDSKLKAFIGGKYAEIGDSYAKSETDMKITQACNESAARVLKYGGSFAFANLPAANATNANLMYNISDEFTTTNDFTEGAGNKYPAGTNIAVVEISPSTYKYDVLAGLYDFSGMVNKDDISLATKSQIDALFESL